jgi:aminopeptidase-like protein
MADEASPAAPDLARVGAEMHALVRELYPICRSITGEGVRQTLRALARVAPLQSVEVPSGTPVLDWTVPPEWNVRDAFVADASGRRVIDFRASNLHLVSYSVPVRARLSLAELRPHLHTLPERPDWIPYRTSYYDETWGFCLTQRQLDALPDGQYDVVVDTTLAPGHLTYGELVLPGQLEDEILISTHVCHPSLADDNLSGLVVSAFLARHLAARPGRRHTLRFLYAPGTIGAITWLARNRATASRVKHGLTLTCLGDGAPFTYKRTVGGAATIDRAAAHVLGRRSDAADAADAAGAAGAAVPSGANQVIDFFPYGYDERQFNSPGFRLPVGSLMRGRHGQFPEYHTSADNPAFVSAARLAESFDVLAAIIDVLDGDRRYRNLAPEGEPQLGKRGLYRAVGGTNIPNLQLAMLWVLNLSDGQHTLLDVAERADMDFFTLRVASDLLVQHGLLTPA